MYDLGVERTLAKVHTRPCPDCPACREGLLETLVARTDRFCEFECATLAARQEIPVRWFERYAVAFIRRGLLIRQRSDASGSKTSIDIAGPGCMFPLRAPEEQAPESTSCGYAVADSLVCVVERERWAVLLDGSIAKDLITLQEGAIERMARLADARGRVTREGKLGALLTALADTISPPRVRQVLPAGLLLRDFGGLLAVRPETVSRAIQALAGVERTPDGLRITDREALENQ